MAIGIGDCYRGRITRIASWGAFAALEDADRTNGTLCGMIHISELSPAYVREVSDIVAVGDVVTVKVLRIDAHGRIALSRRQAMTEAEQAEERCRFGRQKGRLTEDFRMRGEHRHTAENAVTADAATADFEEMMRRFRQSSEEKLTALRRSADGRHGRRKR